MDGGTVTTIALATPQQSTCTIHPAHGQTNAQCITLSLDWVGRNRFAVIVLRHP
jgi:hypothetical protein